MFGTVAKVSGVQGRRADDLSLIVEGIRRFRIDRFVQMRPYFEAEVAFLDDENGGYPQQIEKCETDGVQLSFHKVVKCTDGLSKKLLKD